MSHSIEVSSETQERNQGWWNQNPMSYDWHRTITAPEGSPEFFKIIDERFFGALPFYPGSRPFEGFIPFEKLKGKKVLEIGCGLGAHTQLLCEAGCRVTAIDLTARAVDLTKKRLSHAGLEADVRIMDAEQMEFGDEEFDFVWSWGVIHHSAQTEEIVREVNRVLKGGCEFRLMVYNRRSLEAFIKMMRGLLSGKFFKGMSVPEVLSFYSDGYIARHYTPRQISLMLEHNGFSLDKISILGQKSELIPLPGSGLTGRFKHAVVNHIPGSLAAFVLSIFGWFLFAVAVKPNRIITPK